MNTHDQHHFTKGLDTSALPAVVDRATWQAELDKLRVREKAHTREGDAIAAARRRLPMVEVDPTIQLLGPHGPVTLLEVFEGAIASDRLLSHVAHRSTRQRPVRGLHLLQRPDSRAVLPAFPRRHLRHVLRRSVRGELRYRDFMGWDVPWYSVPQDAVDALVADRRLRHPGLLSPGR